MKVTVDELVKKVRITIDEIALNDAEFSGIQDNSEMETIIREKILEAVRYVHEKAGPEYLEPDTMLTDGDGEEMRIDERLVGRLPLPDNLLRVCYARFLSWPLRVTEYILLGDKEYAMLQDPYTTGIWERPKVALLRVPKWELELYSARTADDSWEVGLITLPEIEKDGGNGAVRISELLLPSLVYHLSGLTLLTYDEQRADSMFNMALALMGVSVRQPSVQEAAG